MSFRETLPENCPHLELFWSVFLRTWTEYEEMCAFGLNMERYSRITPNMDTLYTVEYFLS